MALLMSTSAIWQGWDKRPRRMAATSAPRGRARMAVPAKPPLSNEELEAASWPRSRLYPDSLLSQVLMASTYPLEVVQADRFAKANPKLQGDALAAQLETLDWDPSVKSLVNFPTVLDMMNDKLDATMKLGDAFIADQKSVMDAVQRLRFKAQSAGNLKTTPQQTIVVQQAPETQVQVISIQSPSPQVIYVPTYNPTVVYGAWPYPAYPPYYYRPPGYVAAGVIGFGVGVACGAAWGYAWGNCNWGRNDVNININQNNNFNTKIDRSKYQNQINNNSGNRGGLQNGQGTFQHNPAHREGVPYRDQATAQKYGTASNKQAAESRDAFRGRTETGQQTISTGAADQNRGSAGNSNSPNRGNGNPSAAGTGNVPNRGNGNPQRVRVMFPTAATGPKPPAQATFRTDAPVVVRVPGTANQPNRGSPSAQPRNTSGGFRGIFRRQRRRWFGPYGQRSRRRQPRSFSESQRSAPIRWRGRRPRRRRPQVYFRSQAGLMSPSFQIALGGFPHARQ